MDGRRVAWQRLFEKIAGPMRALGCPQLATEPSDDWSETDPRAAKALLANLRLV